MVRNITFYKFLRAFPSSCHISLLDLLNYSGNMALENQLYFHDLFKKTRPLHGQPFQDWFNKKQPSWSINQTGPCKTPTRSAAQEASWMRWTFPSNDDTSPTCSMMAYHRFPSMGGTPSWMVYTSKIHETPKDDCGYPPWLRKHKINNRITCIESHLSHLNHLTFQKYPTEVLTSALWYCSSTSDRLIFVAEKAM